MYFDGQPAAIGFMNELLGNPLSLTVAIRYLVRDRCHVQIGILWPTSFRWRQNTIGGYVVNCSASNACKSNDLPCAADIGCPQGGVRIHKINSSTGVDDDLNAFAELLKLIGSKA